MDNNSLMQKPRSTAFYIIKPFDISVILVKNSFAMTVLSWVLIILNYIELALWMRPLDSDSMLSIGQFIRA